MALSFSREAVKLNVERSIDIQQAAREINAAAVKGDWHTVMLLSDKIGIKANGTQRDLERWSKEITGARCLETKIGHVYDHDAYQHSSTKDKALMVMGSHPDWRTECVLD